MSFLKCRRSWNLFETRWEERPTFKSFVHRNQSLDSGLRPNDLFRVTQSVDTNGNERIEIQVGRALHYARERGNRLGPICD